MEFMEERIRRDGRVAPGEILKVDTFLNHQIDVSLIRQIAKALKEHFGDREITKVVTIEASGIAIASITAEEFGVPMVFAKKSKSRNLNSDTYKSRVYSYTHDRYYDIVVNENALNDNDKVLLVDDFLANGQAMQGLLDICRQADGHHHHVRGDADLRQVGSLGHRAAGADVAGIGICIEKSFQPGGKALREEGYDVLSMAKIKSLENGTVEFEQ